MARRTRWLIILGLIGLILLITFLAGTLLLQPANDDVGSHSSATPRSGTSGSIPNPTAATQTRVAELAATQTTTALVPLYAETSAAIRTQLAVASGGNMEELEATATGFAQTQQALFATPTFQPEINPDSPTEDPGAGAGPDENPTVIAASDIGNVNFEIISEAGDRLGNGIVRLYSPTRLAANESSEIRLELELNLPDNVLISDLPIPPSLTPTPNVTPALPGTPRPTPTLPPLQNADFVSVYEFMGAELLGVDRQNFRIESIPADGLLNIHANELNRWRWSIRPIGEEAIGINRLQIQIYLPLRRDDGTAFRQETNLLPFEIEVVATNIQPNNGKVSGGDDESDGLPLLSIILGVGVIAGLGGGVYVWQMRRRKSLAIFISYRRADSQGSAGRLYDHLTRTFGKGLVFRDVDDIDYGSDFIHAIDNAVGACEVLIAVIGRQWLTMTDAAGVRRLDNPDDFVRLEIATALRRGIRVIPVLVDDAQMPSDDALPDVLKDLHRRNAIALRNDSFDYDVERLVDSLLNR